MAKYKSPSDYHLDGILHFKNARRITWLEQQEMSRKSSEKKQGKRKQKGHYNKNWDKDLWD